MIKVLIADDEKHARERLKEMLGKYEIFSIEAEAKNGDEVISLIISKKPDIAFLDINMPGVSVFNTISSLKNPPVIIFQTAYSEYAVDAFGISALDYLMKPVSYERLDKTIEKIKKHFYAADILIEEEKKHDKIKSLTAKTAGLIKIIPVEEIYFITSDDGLTFLQTEKEKLLLDKYLNYYENILSDHNFFRANRKDLINLNLIHSIHPMFNGNYIIEMKNNEKIALSRRRTKDLKNIIDF